jgi:hypothetical protein
MAEEAPTVLWDPACCGEVVSIFARSGCPESEPCLRLSALTCRWRLVLDGPLQHLLLYDRSCSLQLCATGASLQRPARLFVALPDPGPGAARRLGLTAALSELLATGRLDPRRLPVDRRSRRLDLVLRALDARSAGASDREIAILLFGQQRVRDDWGRGHDHLRDQVRRAVRRGRYLVNGGYRALLR